MSIRRSSEVLVICAIVLTSCGCTSNMAQSDSTVFSQPWINGADSNEMTLHAQNYDANTVVIRQSLRTSFEAPFMYLVFGEEKALLIDTGAGGVDLQSMVNEQIEAWLKISGREKIALIVMHSHAHGDHVAGDEQFVGRENTVVVGHGVDDVSDFFRVDDWPNGGNSIDLGNRVVDVIPTPGHHDTHVMVYDRSTRLLFSGDVLYPGRLYFQCGKGSEFKASIDRVAEFASSREISWIMGAHIELTVEPGKAYDSNDVVRKDERLLEMTSATILNVQSALQRMGNQLRVEPHDDFILFPHPADPMGKVPPDWCLEQDNISQ